MYERVASQNHVTFIFNSVVLTFRSRKTPSVNRTIISEKYLQDKHVRGINGMV